MKKQAEYSFQRESGVWAVIHWRATGNGRYEGEKIATYNLKEDARPEVS